MKLINDTGPYHEFEYFDVDVDAPIRYQKPGKHVVLSDFVFSLFVQSFDWSNQSIQELDRCGANRLFGRRAEGLTRVIDGWILIIQEAPAHFSIGCGFDLDLNQQVFVQIEREALLTTLRQVRAWAELAVNRGVLMHWGI